MIRQLLNIQIRISFVIVLWISINSTVKTDCPLPMVSNGLIGYPCGLETSDFCQIQCSKNYQLVGKESIRCTENRTWTSLPKCVMISKLKRLKRLDKPNTVDPGDSRCPTGYHFQNGMCYKDKDNTNLSLLGGPMNTAKLCHLFSNPSVITNPSTYDTVVSLIKKHSVQCPSDDTDKTADDPNATNKECSTLARWNNVNHQEMGCRDDAGSQCTLSCDMKLCVKKDQAAVTVTCHMGETRKFAFTFSV